jgi:hypothetical protein
MAKNNTPTRDRTLGLALAFVVVIAFVLFIFLPPERVHPATLPLVRFLASLASALAAYLFMGTMTLGGQIPALGRSEVKAAGSFAVFLLVQLLFYWGLPGVDETRKSSGPPNSTQPVKTPGRKTSKLELALPPESATKVTKPPMPQPDATPLSQLSTLADRPSSSSGKKYKKASHTSSQSIYSSGDAYFDAYLKDKDLTEPPKLIAVNSHAAAAWATALGSSKWQGDSHWGIISFDPSGRRATFTNGPNKAPGILLIQFRTFVYTPYLVYFTVGEWHQSDDQRGWLLVDDMQTDDASGEVISMTVRWGPDRGLEDTWKRFSGNPGA